MLSVFTTLLFFCCFRVSKTIKRRIIVEINGTAVSRAFNGLVGRNEKGDYFVFIDKLTLYFIFVSSCLHFLMFMIVLWLNIKAVAFKKMLTVCFRLIGRIKTSSCCHGNLFHSVSLGCWRVHTGEYMMYESFRKGKVVFELQRGDQDEQLNPNCLYSLV